MQRPASVLLAICAVLCAFFGWGHGACAFEETPGFVSEGKLSALRRLGIDPDADIRMKGNYHWRWRAHKGFAVGVYSCPAESDVVFSRTIDLVMSPREVPCTAPQGGSFRALKLLPDGSVEPLN